MAEPEPLAPAATPRRLLASPRIRAAQADLESAEAPAAAPRMVEELLAAERHSQSYLALIPFLGPWLVRRGEIHTDQEKRTLWWLSIGATLIAVELIVAALPNEGRQHAAIRRRVDAEMSALALVAERYRARHLAYPDAAAWRHFAEQADPRFFDPWGRPYRYEAVGDHFVLSTLGRDGVEGGSGEDADVSFAQPPAEPPMK